MGFKNLIRSQENQAGLERDARLHQYDLDRRNQDEEEERKRKTLIAALRAEVYYLSLKAGEASRWALVMSALFEGGAKEGFANTATKVSMSSFDAPVYKAHIAHLGLLGASLAADVVTVCSRAIASPVAELPKPGPNMMIAKLYEAHQKVMEDWQEDLNHVALRLRALEEGTPDPGQLILAKQQRVKQKK
jgi:hypothetical protein